jgi:DNA-directed RNA polymerase specialized sigma24 family protein
VIKLILPSRLFDEPAEVLKAVLQMNSPMFDLNELEQILNLMCSLSEAERKLISMRASGVCWKLIARELKCHRMTASSRWQRALGKIRCQLNATKF